VEKSHKLGKHLAVSRFCAVGVGIKGKLQKEKKSMPRHSVCGAQTSVYWGKEAKSKRGARGGGDTRSAHGRGDGGPMGREIRKKKKGRRRGEKKNILLYNSPKTKLETGGPTKGVSTVKVE